MITDRKLDRDPRRDRYIGAESSKPLRKGVVTRENDPNQSGRRDQDA